MANKSKLFIIATTFLAILSINSYVIGQSDATSKQSADKPYVTAEMITLPSTADVARYKLTVKGPDNFHFEREFSGENVPFIDPFGIHGELLADGAYAYQLVMMPKMSEDARDALRFARTTGDMSEVKEMRKNGQLDPAPDPMYGYFTIHQGLIVVPDVDERTLMAKTEGRSNHEKPGNPVGSNDEVIGDLGIDDSDLGTRDFLVADDLIVDGSACIGFDCVNGETFGFDTLRLKENNLRIKFDDTSTGGSFPSNDWQLTANASANGGANKFSIDDVTNSRTPFTVEAAAPSHSLYVDDGGRIGVGTSVPSVELHVVDGDSPALRLEQNGSSGFDPQSWDVAGNETNFFVRDVSNGSQLPFRIQPGAEDNSVFISEDSNVGIGTASPEEKLDVNGGISDTTLKVQTSAGVPQILAKHTGSSTNARREMFVLENHGEPAFRFSNTDPTAADDWSMILLSSDRFLISRNGSGANEMQIFNGGNVTIGGTLTQGSDVNIKENFEEVDAMEVLDRIVDLPVTTWNYIHEEDAVRHMGPMAQDFAAAFGLGSTNTGIASVDSMGVMFAAVKGLNQRIDEREADLNEKDNTILQLQKENEELATRFQALEQKQEARIQALEQKQEARIKELEQLIQTLRKPSN